MLALKNSRRGAKRGNLSCRNSLHDSTKKNNTNAAHQFLERANFSLSGGCFVRPQLFRVVVRLPTITRVVRNTKLLI